MRYFTTVAAPCISRETRQICGATRCFVPVIISGMAATWRQLQGATGEECAARLLVSQGLALLARNYRCRTGEIDLICRDGGVLVFVEVRQRSGSRFGGALASVGKHKQRRIRRAAQYFLLRERQWRDLPMRFDVVALQGGTPDVVLLNPAWVAPAAFDGFRRVEIDPAEAYAANALLVGDAVIYPVAFPSTAGRLERAGVRLVTVDVSELAKAEGAVTCCSLILRD
jgi:putative endonuclease